MSNKHTSGPWKAESLVVNGERKVCSQSQDREGAIIAYVGDMGDLFGASFDGEGPANARLIAAAPDLLAALQMFLAEYDVPGRENRPEIAAAHAAVEKATLG